MMAEVPGMKVLITGAGGGDRQFLCRPAQGTRVDVTLLAGDPLSYTGVHVRPPSAVCQVFPTAMSQPRVASVKASWMLAAEAAGS